MVKPGGRGASTAKAASSGYGIPAVAKAITLLHHVSEGGTLANLAGSARELGINRTTLLRLTATLEAARFLERKPLGEGFQIGPGLIGVAAQTFLSRDLAQTALPYLIDLSASFGLSTHLGILDGRDVLYLMRQVPHVFRASDVRVGSRLPAHATSMGRVMLAFRSEAEVRALFAGVALAPATARTVTTLDALLADIALARRAGVAWSRSNYEEGIDSCAAPIFDHTGHVVAAINITGQDVAFTAPRNRRDRIEQALRTAAARISQRLGHVTQVDAPASRRAASSGQTGRRPKSGARS